MKGKKPTRCKDCQSTVEPISWRALCEECAIKRMTKSAVQQSAREGPYYAAWCERMAELMPSKAHKFQ